MLISLNLYEITRIMFLTGIIIFAITGVAIKIKSKHKK